MDIESCAKDGLVRRTPQARLFGSELSSFLREIRLCDQEFAIGIPVFKIKYNHSGFQNGNPFYPFHDQLNYKLVKHFVESKTTKSNVNKFLFEPLIAPLTEKLPY